MGQPGFPILLRAAPAQTLPPDGEMGKPGFPIPLLEGLALPRAGVRGNRVSPSSCLRAWPSQTLPRAGAWGNPVSPSS